MIVNYYCTENTTEKRMEACSNLTSHIPLFISKFQCNLNISKGTFGFWWGFKVCNHTNAIVKSAVEGLGRARAN